MPLVRQKLFWAFCLSTRNANSVGLKVFTTDTRKATILDLYSYCGIFDLTQLVPINSNHLIALAATK